MKNTNIERDRNKAKRDLNRVRKKLVYARLEADCTSRRLEMERDEARQDLYEFIQLIRDSIVRHDNTGKYIDGLIAQSLAQLLLIGSFLKFEKMKSKRSNESAVNQ